MAAPQRYVNYPLARETVVEEKEYPEDKNPPMRGLLLYYLSGFIARFGFVQRTLWNNARFWTIRDMPALDELHARYHPHVIPLGNGEPVPELLDFEDHLRTPRPADILGRYHTVADYHAAYQAKEVTPLQVVEAILPLILRRQTPRSKYDNAWVDFQGQQERILVAARAATERWATGKELGLLDGVPFGVKDEIAVEGWVTFRGMRHDPKNPYFKPEEETVFPVKKLEEMGGIMIGKLAMHELGCDTSGCNPHWGTPTNWLNKSYYPGGSSSGNASATCAGIVPFTVASDAGGSIRIPSCFSGLYGLKPSHHRVISHPHSMCVVGPIAATAADLTIAYRIMSQPNPADPVQGCFHPSIPPSPSAKKTIGIYRSWFDNADPRVLEHCNRAVEHFQTKLGYEVVDITIPYLKELQLTHGVVCITEMAAQHIRRAKTVKDAFAMLGPQPKVFIGVGLQTPALDFYRFNQLRELIMQHLAFLFQKHPGLMIVTPTCSAHGWKISDGDEAYGLTDGNKTLEIMRYIFLSNMTGCPSVTAPVGYNDPEQGEGAVPVGLMAMGEWGAEEQLLAWAAEAETYLHHVYPDGRRRPDEWVDILALAKGKTGSADSNKIDGVEAS